MWQIQIMILDVSQGFQSHQGFHSEGKLGKSLSDLVEIYVECKINLRNFASLIVFQSPRE